MEWGTYPGKLVDSSELDVYKPEYFMTTHYQGIGDRKWCFRNLGQNTFCFIKVAKNSGFEKKYLIIGGETGNIFLS